MNKEAIFDAFRERKRLFFSVSLVVVLSIALFFSGTRLTLAFSERQKTEARAREMERYVEEYKGLLDKANASELHPVAEGEVDRIQTAILLHFQKYKLNLESLKEVQDKKTQHGHVYQAAITGTYESTVDCLRTFFVRSALIGIRELSMQMRNGELHTTLTYKIYTK